MVGTNGGGGGGGGGLEALAAMKRCPQSKLKFKMDSAAEAATPYFLSKWVCVCFFFCVF